MGIDLLQGYHFARPMPEADLVRFVTQADPVPSRVPTTMVTPTAGRPRTVV
jgi:predicted signal transduction protein with EAL and GGDEF domain